MYCSAISPETLIASFGQLSVMLTHAPAHRARFVLHDSLCPSCPVPRLKIIPVPPPQWIPKEIRFCTRFFITSSYAWRSIHDLLIPAALSRDDSQFGRVISI